jgi:beta-lactamase regulating signal transducer with metallopeptidase domain
MTLLKMSIQAGLIIFAIIILRTIALNRLPKASFLAMWGVALLRMLLPFFPSKWNLLSILGEVLTVNSGGTRGMKNEVKFILDGLTMQQSSVNNWNKAEALFPTITAIWLVVTAFLLVLFSLGLIKSYLQLRFAVPLSGNELIDEWQSSHKLQRPLRILQSDRINTPIAVGIVRPCIILPEIMNLSDKQAVGYVLTHEYYHIRRLDMLWKLLMLCAVCIHWFNPFAWGMLIFLNRDLEISCDELVLRHYGENASERKAYAYSLIVMAETRGRLPLIISHFSRNAVEERIISIMKHRKASALATGVAVVVVCLTTAFAASGKGSLAADMSVHEADKAAHYSQVIDHNGNVLYTEPVTDNEKYMPTNVGNMIFQSETILCEEGVAGEHVEANARMAIYTDNGKKWVLKAGQSVMLTLYVEPTENEGSGWSLMFGYGKDDGEFEICSDLRVNSGKTTMTFTMPEDGEYSLFFVNASASAIYVTGCEIAIL